jgi:tetratricopeptide (TPR) repeat protein
MLRFHIQAVLLLAMLALQQAAPSFAEPSDVPPPVNWAQLGRVPSGQDIGLPQGTTTAYALGRSLLKRGETEAALVYLNRAYQQAPDSWLIADMFAAALGMGGYMHDAVRIYSGLVDAQPDSLSQRRQYMLLLARIGRSAEALDQVLELQKQGELDPGLTRIHADLLGRLGRVDAAVDIYRAAIDMDPAFAEESYLAAAALLERAQRHEEMVELLREGAARIPTSGNLIQPVFRYLIQRGQFNEALQEAAAADSRLKSIGASDEPRFTIELAELLLGQGRLSEAQRLLAKAREGGIRSQPMESILARIHLSMDRPSDARLILEQAIEAWPDEAEVHHLLGSALAMENDYGPANEALKAAVELQPDNAPYRLALIRFYLMQSRQDGAGLDDLENRLRPHVAWAAANLEPRDSQGHLLLGYALRHLGDPRGACRHFHLAREINETRLVAGLELSLTLLELGEEEDALIVLQDLRSEYSDNPDVANNLAFTLAERGEELELAEQLVRQALQSDPDNGAYLDSLGWVLYKRGDYEGAFDWLVEAVNRRPDDPVVLEHLALTLHRLGRRDEALDVLQRALSSGGDREHLEKLIAEVGHDR